MKAIAFSENPAALGLPSVWTDHWEPVWDAIDETDLVVCLHIGSSGTLLRTAADAPPSMVLPHVGANSMIACTDWLFTGVLDRHPVIRIAFSEGGAGWVPYLLEQAEKVFARTTSATQVGTTRPPRQVFAEHMDVCFMCDDTALAALDVIGEDNITWESDYPHEDGFFPDSRDPARPRRSPTSPTTWPARSPRPTPAASSGSEDRPGSRPPTAAGCRGRRSRAGSSPW